MTAVAVLTTVSAALWAVTITRQDPPAATIGQQSTGQPSTSAQPVPSPATQPGSQETPAASAAQASSAPLHSVSFFVMIDPGHGGEDSGAHLGDGLLEKDLTLTLAHRVKADLAERGIPARLLRETDTSLGLDERAEISNGQHAAVYLSLHAGTPGDGVRVYAPALPSPPPETGRFLPWESAQSLYLVRSRALVAAVAGELKRRRLDVATLSSPLRPLNNVAAYALAVELAEDKENPRELASPKLQNAVAAGIAAAVAQMRSQLEGQP
ncbi:MAG TPA: N-acetylmuramoyl-L-alanine amidase [Candidatus Saccharimonadales bacterium]|nr:N-acetylmuramoyl-L-alanine amidase [Candidatus Saccharimonadales bacterium]